MEGRRTFLTTRLPAGFALAVQPAAAAITTDTRGLVAEEVSIPAHDGKSIPAYAARPARLNGYPIVLVVEEIFGVQEYMRDVCRRLAKLGYFAIAPELFLRQGDPSKTGDVRQILNRIVSKTPDSQVMDDLDATLEWAIAAGKLEGTKIAITGFSWGGRITWLYAAHQPKVKAAAAWYGVLARPSNPLHPVQPIDLAASLKTPVLGLYGGQDRGIPPDTVERMRAELAKGTSRSEIAVYPDAPHGFHADYRDGYRPAEAHDAWNRMLAWFKKYDVA
ncbi:MAG: dienelactone hydrolase family protein [Bryobacterales bacterium]|nr:dienelactone hydrolase family protein [Bryobacterales bacterium]